MKKVLLLLVFCCFHYNLIAQIEDAWIYFADKENVAASIANPLSILTQKAIDRKNAHGVVIDDRDVPVNETYITQLKNATGISVLAKSKWFNAVHVRGSQTEIESLTSFTFVSVIDFANKNLNAKGTKTKPKQEYTKLLKEENNFTVFNYGDATNQIEMFNGDKLHLADYTGDGMTIAVLDSGFPNVDNMTSFQRLRNAGNILGTYDFVNRDIDVYTGTTSSHGTWVLSDMAGYIENNFVGTAPDASYYLFITEDAPNENPVEESYWVEAVERADSLGVDLVNTSLGYTTYDNPNYSYTQADMDGNTAFISKGANIAFEKGLLLVTSAGNSGNTSWGIVSAPADASGVFSVGAVDLNGNYASFSSRGNATQPNQKPDVVAQGQASYVIGTNDVIGTLNGTSFSSPILAGGITCLWQALPNKTNAEIMQLVRESATQFTSPDYFLGYGIPNLEWALNTTLAFNTDLADNFDVQIYPNPVRDNLFIKLPDLAESTTLKIYNILGEEINTYNISESINEINTVSLAQGLYIVKLTSKTYSKSVKLIKQ